MISLDEGQVRFRCHINVSSHLQEVDLADIIYHLMNLTHMDGKLLFCFSWSVNFEIIQEFRGHRDKCLLRPWQEPID